MVARLYQIRGDLKQCTACKEFKAFAEFSANPALAHGRQSHCKKCSRGRQASRRKDPAYKERFRASYRKHALKRNGKRRIHLEKEMLYRARARAKKRGAPCTIVVADIQIPEFCPVFNLRLEIGRKKISPTSPSLDCIVPEKGYVRGNIQVISNLANRMKSNASESQLRQFALWILESSNGSSETSMAPRQGAGKNSHQSAH